MRASADTRSPGRATSIGGLSRRALPVGAFHFAEVALGLTDLVVVGTLGTDELAAVGLGRTIVFACLAVGLGVLSAALVFLSEGDDATSATDMVRGSVGLACLGAVATLAVPAVAGASLVAAGYERGIVAAFADYTGALVWLVLPAAVYSTLKDVLAAAGRTAVLGPCALVMVVGNAALSIVLVHGVPGVEGMGVSGAAVATVIANAAAAIGLWRWCRARGLVQTLRPRGRGHEALARARGIAVLGWPGGVQQGAESVLFVIVLFLLGTLSPAWLVAGGVAFAVMEVDYVVGTAYGEVTAARVAHLMSIGKSGAARAAAWNGAIGCALVVAAFAIATFCFPGILAAPFLGESAPDATRALVSDVLRWTAPIFVLDALQVLFAQVLRAVRSTVVPMLASLFVYWVVGLGGGAAGAFLTALGASALWAGFCIGLVSAALVLGTLLRRRLPPLGARRAAVSRTGDDGDAALHRDAVHDE